VDFIVHYGVFELNSEVYFGMESNVLQGILQPEANRCKKVMLAIKYQKKKVFVLEPG